MAASLPSDDLTAGTIFAERYEILSLLGRGGMAQVFRARDLAVGEEIALKVLHLGTNPSGTDVERFRQEVRLARRVTHANVARVYDIAETGGLFYLTMELVDGRTLREILRSDGRLAPSRVVAIGKDLAAGLGAAHAAGVMHRDLKPGNVLLDRRGRAVITDFGVAKNLIEDTGLTVGAIGTPAYMAPEQLAGGKLDERTDLYSLGLVLHEMLAGDLPSRGPSNLRDIDGIPTSLVELVERCRSVHPDARPRSALEVGRALEAVAQEHYAARGAVQDDGTRKLEPGEDVDSEATRVTRERMTTKGTAALDPSCSQSRSSTHSIAVLPFKYRGPREDEEVGEAITDELCDQLSRTRGFRVFGTAATSRFDDHGDVRAIGLELGARAVVSGSAERRGDKLKLKARLVECATGAQLWAESFEGELCDLFELGAAIARRVAEQLRVEIETLAHGRGAPEEAIEAYLTARRKLRSRRFEVAREAHAGLAKSVALAPSFPPAVAAFAIACVRCWFLADPARAPTWETDAQKAVDRAMALAPELPETHYAAALLSSQHGRYGDAASALHRSLDLAPTYVDALEYLGGLECEAELADAGVPRIQSAIALDPTATHGVMVLIRHYLLRGDHRRFEETFAEFEQAQGSLSVAAVQIGVRMAVWRRDYNKLQAYARGISGEAPIATGLPLLYARAALGEVSEEELVGSVAKVLDNAYSPRFLTLILQILTEQHAVAGRIEAAELALLRAATSVLLDLEWLDRCPLLDELRRRPRVKEARLRVRDRAATVRRS